MIAPLALALALALVCGRCAAHPLDAGGGGAAGGAWRSSWRLKADDGSAGAGPVMEPALLAKIKGKPNWSEGVKSSVQSGLRSCRESAWSGFLDSWIPSSLGGEVKESRNPGIQESTQTSPRSISG